MSRVLVVVSGGVVQAAYTDDPELVFDVLDHDEVGTLFEENEADYVTYLTELGNWLTGVAVPVADTHPEDIEINREVLPNVAY